MQPDGDWFAHEDEAEVAVRLDYSIGIALVYGMLLFGQGWMASEFGLYIGMKLFSLDQVYVILLVALFGCLVGLIPGIRMYRYSLIDGMTVRV